MALITCPECGAQISDKATTCPQCGHPMTTTVVKPKGGLSRQILDIGWMSIAVTLAIIMLFFLLGTCKWAPL
jgi:uncharacterized membrane protein YvbJ